MLLLYQVADHASTLVFLVCGTWALFYRPDPNRPGLFRGSAQARRRFFQVLGCIFSLWGWLRLFQLFA